MIKVENAVHDGQRRALISDGVYVNVSATEQDVDTLLSLLATWKKGVAVVDETFLRQAAVAMKHGPGGTGERGDCSPDCAKCKTEKLYESVRTSAKAGDSYRFEYQETQFNKTLKVVSVTGTGPEDLVFFEDGTHSKQGRLNPSMRA